MNFDDYETLWRAQPIPAGSDSRASSDHAALADHIRRASARFDRAVFWRDVREISASFAVAAVFGAMAWRNTGTERTAWGQWIAAALVLAVAVVILRDRRRVPSAPPADSPLLIRIDASLARLRHQAGVLARVPLHYALPLWLGTLASGLDSIVAKTGWTGVPSVTGGVVFGVATLVACGVVWLNRVALRRVIRPKIAELEQLRGELTSNG